jgi:hydrogenase 3 maturation protease
MPDLRAQLQQLFQGRICLMGLGNVDHGDDGFGVRLAEELKFEGRNPKAERSPKSEGRREDLGSNCSDFEPWPSFAPRGHAIVAGRTPERLIGRIAQQGFDHLIFLDAVDFGGAAGSVILLNSDEVAARYPQVSTHKISLGLLAKWAEANGTTKAWLLGVQPESLKPGDELTPRILATLELLLDLLRGCLKTASSGGRASMRAQTASEGSRIQGSRGRSPSRAEEVMV